LSDNKKLLKYLGVLFIVVLLTSKVPYDSYSIIEYIIRPIGLNGGTLYISGFVPLVIFIIGLRGLFKLERFQNTNKILIIIAVILMILPVMQWTVDAGRTAYHRLNQHELRAVDIVDADISLSGSKEEIIINSRLKLTDYSSGQNRFKVRLYLPKTLAEYTGKAFYDFEQDFVTYGHRNENVIEKQIIMELEDEQARNNLLSSGWYGEDFEYKLYNEQESITIINRSP